MLDAIIILDVMLLGWVIIINTAILYAVRKMFWNSFYIASRKLVDKE